MSNFYEDKQLITERVQLAEDIILPESIDNYKNIKAKFYFFIYTPLVNKDNINMVISSVLTFLNRVQSLNTRGVSSVYYSRLISQSNRLYGKHIKNAIHKFLKSNSNNLISLYNMLSYLNGAK